MARPRKNLIEVRSFWREGRGYTLWWRDPLTHQKRTKSAQSSKPKEVEREAAELEIEIRAGRGGSSSGWCAIRKRAEDHYPKGSSRGWGEMVGTMDLFESVIGAPPDMGLLDSKDVERFVEHLRGPRDLADATISKHLRNIRALLNWAKARSMIARVPSLPFPAAPSGYAGKGDPAKDGDLPTLKHLLTDFVPAAHHTDWCFMLDGLRNSGLRLTEMLRISWDELPVKVIFDGPDAVIQWEGGQKSGKFETSPTVPAFADLLLSVPPSRRVGPVFNPIGDRGERLRHWEVGRRIVYAASTGNLPIKPHDLRRAFAEEWSSKVMPADLARLMRCGLSVIMKYYAKGNALGTSRRIRAMQSGTDLAPETPKSDRSRRKQA